jgi:hypothetical protein
MINGCGRGFCFLFGAGLTVVFFDKRRLTGRSFGAIVGKSYVADNA